MCDPPYTPFPRSHTQQETPPPPYSGFRNPSTPNGLGPTRRPGTASSAQDAALPPVTAPIPTDSAWASDTPLPCASQPHKHSHLAVESAPQELLLGAIAPIPEPETEIFPADLPPRPAATRTAWHRLPIRFYVSPRPRVHVYDADIELDTLPSRTNTAQREDLVSSEPVRASNSRRQARHKAGGASYVL
ncbi:hypothetical protein EK21DRAFT_108371 [Setomelanomma holmii]|uniref:Uncharacterized protein n=1 Tax=Setomelanomma holmii TaxID=210430 RepID=A0A9P4HI22_9PLEO|nr:hypothetical protein EK21DRAFT_108371 [Setomelanomma holmii]